MQKPTEILRRQGGSIDVAYYARIGRSLHAHAVRGALASLARWLAAGLQRVARRRTDVC